MSSYSLWKIQVFKGIKEHLLFFLVQVYLILSPIPTLFGNTCGSFMNLIPFDKKYWTYFKICILKVSFKHSISYLNSSFILTRYRIYTTTPKVKIIKCIYPTQILKFMFQYSWCFTHYPWQRSSPYLSNFFKIPGILGLLELNPIKIYLNSICV